MGRELAAFKTGAGEWYRMPYYAHITQRGPVKDGQVPESIGVLEAIDHLMPTGEHRAGRGTRTGSRSGLSRSKEILGRWVLIDHEFRPAQ